MLIKKLNVLKPVKLVNVIKIDVYTCVMLTDEAREKALERHKRWKNISTHGSTLTKYQGSHRHWLEKDSAAKFRLRRKRLL